LTVDSKVDAVRPHAGPADLDASDAAGLLLGRLTVLPALILLPFLLTSFLLLLAGLFKPVPVILLWLALTAAMVPYVWRRIPSVTGAADWGTPGTSRATATPRWVLWSLLAISVVFGIYQAAFHSQFVIVQLDAASYTQFASWISQHGSLPIPVNTAAFGHAPAVTYASAAFYQVGNSLVPQFMAGLPMLLSLGFWAGGVRVAVLFAPVLGALGIFTFGGLVARLVGPRWAPLGALAMSVTIPELYVSRNTYSETLAQILFLGALSLWIDAQRTDRGDADAGRWRANWRSHSRSASHVLAGVTGLMFGITLLVRIDGPADILFIIPYCGLLVLRRQRQVIALVAGLLVGTLYGVVDAGYLTLPYLKVNKSSVKPLVAVIVLMVVGTLVVAWWMRRRGYQLRAPFGPRLTQAVTILPFLVTAVFVIRPYVERNWHALQYAPLSLHWLYWYVGGPIIVFTVIGFAMLGRRCMRGEAPAWVLPLVTFGWCITYFLLRPAITPHQPYASRRLAAAVLPGMVLLSIWLTAWLVRRSRVLHLVDVPPRLYRAPGAVIAVVCTLAVFLPGLIDSDGLAFQRTYVGEIAAINAICKAVPANSSVLIDDYTMNQQFAEAIRGTCDVPVAGVGTTVAPGVQVIPVNAGTVPGPGVPVATVLADIKAIQQAGRHPFVIAPSSSLLTGLGNGAINFVMAQETNIDEHATFGTPRSTIPQRFTVYSWEPAK
jgi:hypothetical protein